MKVQCYFVISLFLFTVFYPGLVICAEYKLGAGDTISIIVYNEKEMSVPQVRIPKIGKITIPFIGDITALGLTTRKLKKIVSSRLRDGYLKNPQLIVSIIEYRPFFVNGEVKNPGGYPYIEGLTIRKAIAISGGLTDRASLKKISLISEKLNKKRKIKKSLEVYMNPGDILTIGEALF